jgi:hypothetical protein
MSGRCTASCLVLSLALAGCAPDGPVSAPPGAAASAQSILPTPDNGLQVRQWRVPDDPDAIASALVRHARGGFLDTPASRRLDRNGLRFVRVSTGDLETLLADLGGATRSVDTWHGQACDWRAVADWPIEATGRALAVDGRVRRFEGGRLQLMIRAWTIQMEDGPSVRLQLEGRYNRSQPTRLDQVLRRQTVEGRRLPSISLDLLLEAGYAYVLTGEPPGNDWEPGEAGAPPAPEDAEGREAGREEDRPSDEPEIIGPDALPPLTVGELLFRREALPATRHLLVFVPRIPDRLFPPEAVTGSAGAGREVLP